MPFSGSATTLKQYSEAFMARKRLLQEVDSFDSLDEPLANASVHASITALSPVRKGKNSMYFDGTVTDGTTHLRLVGFDSDQQKKLASFLASGQPAHLTNCEIKTSRQGEKLEILLKKFTDISKSPKKINIPEEDLDVNMPSVVKLSQLPQIQDFQRISLDIKVVYTEKPLEVTGGKRKQDVIISDDTGTARLTLWENKVNSLDEDLSYALRNVTVRQFRGQKYVSFPRTGSSVEEIPDIGDVVDYDPDSDDGLSQLRQLTNAVIIGVLSLDSYKSCFSCKARVESTSPPFGRCTKCCIMVRMDKCGDQLTAKLVFEEGRGATSNPLSVFGALLQQMCSVSTPREVTQEALLRAPPFRTVTYNDRHVVTGIARESVRESSV